MKYNCFCLSVGPVEKNMESKTLNLLACIIVVCGFHIPAVVHS